LAQDKTFYITTPIYYVNGVPHVGSATTTLLCDAVARFHRLRGERVFFLTGTDENAPKVAAAAAKEGVPTQAFADSVSQRFRDCWQYLHISNDDFIRTSEPRHRDVVAEVFRRLQARGDIYAGKYEGWYSVADETFFLDSEVEDGRAKESGALVERVTEDNYYFRLSAYSDRLLAHIEAHPEFLQPETRRNEVLAFIKSGLRDVVISRRNNGWGIPVPGDDTQVVYVWFDALINYLTATGWPQNAAWDSVWPADVHLVGKEIYTRFHATLWPAMLMGLDLPLPHIVLGHGWWLIGGEKGSKSKGNIPTPQEVVEELVAKSGATAEVAKDALRYYLLRDISFTSDAEFSIENLIEKRYNPELCNKLGNLLNRTLKMLAQYAEGRIPAGAAERTVGGVLATLSREISQDVERAMLALDPSGALESIIKLVEGGNGAIDTTAPWKLHKAGNTEGVADALYATLEATRIVSILLTPLLPHVAGLIRAQLGLAETPLADWAHETVWGGLPGGLQTEEAQPIFPRIDTKKTNPPSPEKPKKEPKHQMAETMPPPPPILGEPDTPANPYITIDDFAKIQLKIGEIKTAERVEGATKLLKLTVDIGEETPRQILAGIAESYTPESIVGRKIVVVANLAPRKMRGLESQGMLMAATDAEGHAVLLHPADPDAVPPGAQVR
jgi:methionyl-tRNA synthetase